MFERFLTQELLQALDSVCPLRAQWDTMTGRLLWLKQGSMFA